MQGTGTTSATFKKQTCKADRKRFVEFLTKFKQQSIEQCLPATEHYESLMIWAATYSHDVRLFGILPSEGTYI